MRRRMARSLISVLVTALTAGAAAGCGGGGGGSGQVVPQTCITVVPSGNADPSTVVAMPSGAACDTVDVRLVMTGVTDVQTVEFTVDFDASVASYVGLSLTGSVLTTGGANITIFEDKALADQGLVTVDLTRLNTGVDFMPGGTLATLSFGKATSTAGSSGPISFSSTQVYGSEAPPQEKAGIQWIGGTFEVD